MADMCGPSNALSNFQKHSTVDRTLQQDRIISRQSPTQGFRSTPSPNARQLDSDFEAFQAGNLPLGHGFENQGLAFSQQTPQNSQSGPANWASDFQRMNISSPPPTQQFQQGFGGQVQQRHDTGGWHQDFAQQQSQGAGLSMVQAEQYGGYMQRFPTMSGGLGMDMGQQYGGFAVPQQEVLMAQQQPAELFDEEAFARAFDEAAKAEMDTQQESSILHQGMELGQDIMIAESAERLMSSSPLSRPLDQAPIGADTIHDPNQPQSQHEQQDPDALARTAGRLLDRVQHDPSAKFKQSQFMELMRQFRDREATVKGDDVVGPDSRIGGEGMSDESIKKQISDISHVLKKALLDRDRPFQRTPRSVRNLLLNLLQLDRLLNSTTSSSRDIIEKSRLQRILAATVASPSLNGLPSVRILAIYLLSATSNLSSSSDNVSNTDGGQEDALASEDLADIAAANGEISQYDADSASPAGNTQMHESEFTTLEREYIGKVLEMDGGREELLSYLLGYNITPHAHGNSPARGVHQQRARDILGPAISSVLDVCRKRGFFCTELSTNAFFELVRRYEEFGKESEGFSRAVTLAERHVEEILGGYLSRFVGSEGRMGNGELEVPSGEEEERRIEKAQARMRHMKLCRTSYPLPGEKHYGEEWVNKY